MRELTPEEIEALSPRTTAGGVARSFAGGAAKGAAALPEMAAGAANLVSRAGRSTLGEVPYLGAALRPGYDAQEWAFGKVGDAANWVQDRAEDVFGGTEVGDTAPERYAGAIGEVAGSVASGGAAMAPVRGAGVAARALSGLPATVGAGAGLGAARELGQDMEEGPAKTALEVGGSLVGGSLGQLAKSSSQWGGRIGRAIFRDPGEQPLDPVTKSILKRREVIDAEDARIGDLYNRVESAMDDAGLALDATGLKSRLSELYGRFVTPQAKQVRRVLDPDALPDQIPLRELRGWQRWVNQELAKAKKKGGGKAYALGKVAKEIRDEIASAADNIAEGAVAIPGEVRHNVASALRETNRQWGVLQDAIRRTDTFEKASDALVRNFSKQKHINPNTLTKWLRNQKNRREVIEQYGEEHYQNLMRLTRNVDRIPDEIARQIVGPLDEGRDAIIEGVMTGGRIATAPIGSMRYRGRRIAETVKNLASSLSQERRGLALAQAIADPELAKSLLPWVAGKSSWDLSKAVYPAALTAPGFSEGSP